MNSTPPRALSTASPQMEDLMALTVADLDLEEDGEENLEKEGG